MTTTTMATQAASNTSWAIIEHKINSLTEEDYNRDIEQQFGSNFKQVTKLILDTSFINEIPSAVLNFTNLRELKVCGSRFWNLNMTQVPPSVSTLVLVEQSNLQSKCVVGMDRLQNLQRLELDCSPFGFEAMMESFLNEKVRKTTADVTPLEDLDTLREVVIHGNFQDCTDEEMNDPQNLNRWLNKFKMNPLFDKIRERINSIDVDKIWWQWVSIMLRPKTVA